MNSHFINRRVGVVTNWLNPVLGWFEWPLHLRSPLSSSCLSYSQSIKISPKAWRQPRLPQISRRGCAYHYHNACMNMIEPNSMISLTFSGSKPLHWAARLLILGLDDMHAACSGVRLKGSSGTLSVGNPVMGTPMVPPVGIPIPWHTAEIT